MKRIILIMIIIGFFVMGAVSASNETDVIAAIDENDDTIGLSDSEEVLEASYSTMASSYSDLVSKIDSAKNTNYNEYTINLKSGTYHATGDMTWWGTYESVSGTKTLIINGNGATLDGDNKHSFLGVENGYTLVLNNLKLQNFVKTADSGYLTAMDGAAIYNTGTLIVDHCEFSQNSANDGGAIYSDGILIVRNSIFTSNVAKSCGGAITTKEGKCDIQNSNFISNKASSGGAIYSGSNGAIISGNLFAKNEAKKGGGIYNGFIKSTPYGGAIYDRWGNRIEGDSTPFGIDTSISKNKFSYNTADEGAGVFNNIYSVSIDSNIFKSNQGRTTATQVIENTADNVEISNNNVADTGFKSAIKNTRPYSRITNNVFDDRPDTIITVSFEKTPYVYGKDQYVTISLKDDLGNALTGFDLTVIFNGVKVMKTDANGQIKLSTKGLAPKTYQITVSYAGNSQYVSSSKTANVVINKLPVKLTAKAKTFKKSAKTKKYTIVLKNAQNKPMKKVKVTLKIKKKTYRAKTNSKGKATFKLKIKKKGKYTGTVTYPGNAYNQKITKKVKIIVK